MSTTQTQTMTLVEPKLNSVETKLNFFKSLSDEPAFVDTVTMYRNYGEDNQDIKIYDIRGHEQDFSLDKTGFQVCPHKSSQTEFADEEKIKSIYYKEVEELLKEVTGAHKVVIFDHRVRHHILGVPTTLDNPGPVTKVHVDQSTKAAYDRVRRHAGDEAEQLLKERFQIINVWRSIGGPVEESPLAVSDFRSIDVD